MKNTIFTSESVSKGHPDKLCDAISDAILDAYLQEDADSRVACETCVTSQYVLVMGEVTSQGYVDVERVVRQTILDIGYDTLEKGMDGHSCVVDVRLHKQSSDIAQGVDEQINGSKPLGAGDQGMMFGYACDETRHYMPYAITMAHALVKKLDDVRNTKLKYLRPDGKSQVSVQYDDKGNVERISSIVISAQHDETISQEQLHVDIRKEVIDAVVPPSMITADTKIYINPTGRFVIGGPEGDSGLTGRKIIVDTYGGYAHHGGGAFSGKDPTKVDRSAAYLARYIAKNIVASGLAKECEIQLSYAIGIAKPISISIQTFSTSPFSEKQLQKMIESTFDLSPQGMIDSFNLKRPIYKQTSSYGHFGNDVYPWEQLDKVETLKKLAGI